MTTITSSHKSENFHELLSAARHYLGGRRTLTVLAIAAIAAGLALNWSWLVTAGLAPLVLTLLPCTAMCALHLCMKSGGEGHCKEAVARDGPQLLPAPVAERRSEREHA
jgi:hypothetical protein